MDCNVVRIPMWAIISAPVQTDPGCHVASYATGIPFIPGIKWPGRGFGHLLHPPPGLRKCKALPLHPLWTFMVVFLYYYHFMHAHHVTRHNTPIHNILSTAPQLSISQKALGTLPEDGNVMPKHVGYTIYNTSQQDFGPRKVYCVSNVTFHAESKYAIEIFQSPTVFVQWHFLLLIFRNFSYFFSDFFLHEQIF
jgi:hypothetical protein